MTETYINLLINKCSRRRWALLASLVIGSATMWFVWLQVQQHEIRALRVEVRRLRGHIEIEGNIFLDLYDSDILVDLDDTKTGDVELAKLIAMPAFRKIRRLSLSRTRVTSSSLKLLATVSGLQLLNIDGNRISDEAMESIASLALLGTLHLDGTDVSDVGLRTLIERRENLKLLSMIGLRDTKVTAEGVESLISAFRPRRLVVDHPAAMYPPIGRYP